MVIGLERFGASAPYKVIAKELGFTPESVAERVRDYLKERKRNPERPTIEGSPACP
jgi:transketolase